MIASAYRYPLFLAGMLLAFGVDLLFLPAALAQDNRVRPSQALADGLSAFAPALSGQQSSFELQGQLAISIDKRPQTVHLRLARHSEDSFDLELTHDDYAVSLRRRDGVTALALPKHQVVFVGQGTVGESDHLRPIGFAERCLSSRTSLSTFAPLVFQPDATALAAMMIPMLGVEYDANTGQGVFAKENRFQFGDPGELTISGREFQLSLSLRDDPGTPLDATDWPGMQSIELPREEIERQLSRGLRRAFEIQFPSRVLTQPLQKERQVDHGELKWIEGHRVVVLRGTPEQIGTAHGQLLREEAQACIDSVLYTFGTVETIRRGRWFRAELDSAYERLRPFIPERHKVETRALARALGQDEALLETLNVFPELFHCSGFALFGSATVDGKLYHGRVLDYMTAIGLQDAATTFVVESEDLIPFVNVGYAAFVGSVSGMNSRSISLGEMGGRGEGNWDGVPMATLMRRALEECETLEEVMKLWTDNPRTCEYYYVFADGKTNQAVGVAAVPESIEFVLPGQSHERLGEGIEDAVVLSAGSRLETLRERVQNHHGKVDESIAKWLMSRPVAMESNLHNVLFIPADGVLYVANADHKRPAAECPYVRLDLNELLGVQRVTSE